MSNSPTSISALIDQWPTIVEFAADVGCGYEAARQMRRRESIDPKHWPKVVSVSEGRGIEGVTFEWLAAKRAAIAERAEMTEAAE
jgi:hypothetical protein